MNEKEMVEALKNKTLVGLCLTYAAATLEADGIIRLGEQFKQYEKLLTLDSVCKLITNELSRRDGYTGPLSTNLSEIINES